MLLVENGVALAVDEDVVVLALVEDVLEDLGVADAFDGDRTVQLDVAPAVVLDRFSVRCLRQFHQNERDLAALVLEVYVHVLGSEALANGALSLEVALDEALDLDLLLQHLLQLGHLRLDAFRRLRDLLSLVFVQRFEGQVLRAVLFRRVRARLLVAIGLSDGDIDIGAGTLGGSDLLGAIRLLRLLMLVDDGLEVVREAIVELRVEGDLFALLGEDIAGEEDVQRVVDPAPQVLDLLPVDVLLNSLLFEIVDLGAGPGLPFAALVLAHFQHLVVKGQLSSLGSGDEVRDLLVSGRSLVEEHLEHLSGNRAQAAVAIEKILRVAIFILAIFLDAVLVAQALAQDCRSALGSVERGDGGLALLGLPVIHVAVAGLV